MLTRMEYSIRMNILAIGCWNVNRGSKRQGKNPVENAAVVRGCQMMKILLSGIVLAHLINSIRA